KTRSHFQSISGGKDIRRRDGVNCHRLSNSLASDAIYCIRRYFITGKDTLHDTVGIMYQNVSHDYDIELNSSSISGNIVRDVCGLKQLQDVSADLQPNKLKFITKQLSDFNEIFENNINPFDESLDKDSLYNIATAKPVPENAYELFVEH
ncbi:hypothetical protein TNCV_1060641, partial [Trichonephila clavipes]